MAPSFILLFNVCCGGFMCYSIKQSWYYHNAVNLHRNPDEQIRAKWWWIMLCSYFIIVTLMIEQGISSIIYSIHNWNSDTEIIIIYSTSTDSALYYIFWVGFWLFVTLRTFRYSKYIHHGE